MRPLLFLVADSNMESALRGFFGRPAWHLSLGCGAVDFVPHSRPGGDIVVPGGANDPGIYTRADALLSLYVGRYEHVVVMLDAEWDGSPGAAAIAARVREHLQRAGWAGDAGLALVLEPEVDNWLWTRGSDHVAAALGWKTWAELDASLSAAGWAWRDGKPVRPKEAAEWALRQKRKPRSSRVYEAITAKTSVKGCVDPAYQALRDALLRWFPSE